ncbi:hypothetical protein F5Y14DRAFT_409688 [Nemania sp. NC0429]|nr:hypothetical protein F5Y14DRAFT_409688 [Nemania sp. NC0429]
MPPRPPAQLRRYGRRSALFNGQAPPERQSICFFCSLSSDFNRERLAQSPKKRVSPTQARRLGSTAAIAPLDAKADPRRELESALVDLQKYAANHVNLSRLQLALNGLRQEPGRESIRVAIFGLARTSTPQDSTAKDVLKLLLSDPLKDPAAWEREVEQHDLAEPMIIRIGAETRATEPAVSLTEGNLLREIHVPSAVLNGHDLEILLANIHPFLPVAEKGTLDSFEDTLLVPTVDIPTSSTGRHTPVTTPVHKALVVADGMHGAASVMSLPTVETPGVLKYAVNMPGYNPAETSPLPFIPVDTSMARIGLGLIRKNIGNAIEYEHLWFQSNLPKLVEWLKAGALEAPNNITKSPVRELIVSLLKNTSASIRAEQSKLLDTSASSANTPASIRRIESALSEWAEGAHSELQEQLDVAFSSRRWRKLGWWKLFWRVDDVGMLTSDILAQKFLPVAERNSIFLAGRMSEVGVHLVDPSRNSHKSDTINVIGGQSIDEASGSTKSTRQETKWPANIPNTRDYLQIETIPALQALAQKLVLQTISTSGLMTALGALAYIGTPTSTLYEAGAIATLGIVWSLRRMQKRWETARDFWEGEVREEGRKAVRGVEEAITTALSRGSSSRLQGSDGADAQHSLEKASQLVNKAQALLKELK